MQGRLSGVAILITALTLTSLAFAGDEDKVNMAKAAAKEKAEQAKAAAKERADKAKEAAREKAKKPIREKALMSLGPQKEGYFLIALEEVAGLKVNGVTIALCEGRDATGEEIANFLIDAGRQVRRSVQFISRFDVTEKNKQRAEAHRAKLQHFVGVRLSEPVFSTKGCYSELESGDKRSINEKLADGTIVRYDPFR